MPILPLTNAMRAETFAREFNEACYRLRGFEPGNTPADTVQDVTQMTYRFPELYDEGFENNTPEATAKTMTFRWWDLSTESRIAQTHW